MLRKKAITTKVMTIIWVIFTLILISCSGLKQKDQTPTPDPEQSIVDPNFLLGDISPYVYGVNHGPWAYVTTKVLPQALEGGFSFIRFPGGNWGDRNTLSLYDIENASTLAEMMGSELSISVRLRGGSIEEALEVMRKTNEEFGLSLKYWSIGNEPALYPDYDTKKYNQEWRVIAKAMKDMYPDILLIGPDITQFTGNAVTDPKDENGLFWMDEFLQANGDLVDIISIHRYPFPKSMISEPATVSELYASAAEWDKIIPALRNKILEITGKDLPIAVTEVNSHWTTAYSLEASPDSFANAIWWADVLSRLIKNDVEIVTYFSLQSNVNIGGYGVLDRYKNRPTYYVYKLYKEFGHDLIYSDSNDPEVSIIASRCMDEDITLILINHSLSDKKLPLDIRGTELLTNKSAMLLAQDIWAENVVFENYYNNQEVFLPPESVLLLTLSEDKLFCTENLEQD